jgi:hypothetical protein
MVLAFDNAGSFAKAVYGDASSQHVGTNGAIATSNPSTTMKGGRNRSRRNQNGNRNRSRRNQTGNRNRSRRNQTGGRNNSRRNNSRRQRGGK